MQLKPQQSMPWSTGAVRAGAVEDCVNAFGVLITAAGGRRTSAAAALPARWRWCPQTRCHKARCSRLWSPRLRPLAPSWGREENSVHYWWPFTSLLIIILFSKIIILKLKFTDLKQYKQNALSFNIYLSCETFNALFLNLAKHFANIVINILFKLIVGVIWISPVRRPDEGHPPSQSGRDLSRDPKISCQ